MLEDFCYIYTEYNDRWQKTDSNTTAKQLLKMFLKFNQRRFSNIATGDETLLHYFEPVRKMAT